MNWRLNHGARNASPPGVCTASKREVPQFPRGNVVKVSRRRRPRFWRLRMRQTSVLLSLTVRRSLGGRPAGRRDAANARVHPRLSPALLGPPLGSQRPTARRSGVPDFTRCQFETALEVRAGRDADHTGQRCVPGTVFEPPAGRQATAIGFLFPAGPAHSFRSRAPSSSLFAPLRLLSSLLRHFGGISREKASVARAVRFAAAERAPRRVVAKWVTLRTARSTEAMPQAPARKHHAFQESLLLVQYPVKAGRAS